MQLAANLSWLYRDLDWGARFEAAARDGFRAAEILLPYEHPPQWYAERLRDAGLALVLINTPIAPGAGRLGWAALPGAQAEFRAALDRARAVAQATGCPALHVMAGHVAEHAAADCDATLRRNGGRGVVTEYAWQSSSCDPCPVPPLSDQPDGPRRSVSPAIAR